MVDTRRYRNISPYDCESASIPYRILEFGNGFSKTKGIVIVINERYINVKDEYPDTLYACPNCLRTQKVVGIGTVMPDLTCKCEYPIINQMVEMIPKLPEDKDGETNNK